MSAEKMKILTMLEEGKITAEEASKLLQSITTSTSEEPKSKPSFSSSDTTGRTGYSSNSNSGNSSRPSGDGLSFDDYARDFGRKIETLARDLEPKIQKIAEVVVERTATYADKVSKTMSEAAKSTGNSASNTGSASRDYMEKNFEMVVSSSSSEINLTGVNANVSVKGYNGDKITAKVFYKAKKAGAELELIKLGNKYHLNFDEDDFRSVAIDALIPESMFKNVTLRTTNGGMEIATIKAENVLIETSNGKVVTRDINSEILKIETSNGSLELGNINSAYAQFETSNSAIKADRIDISKMRLMTSNNTVNVIVSSLEKYDEYSWAIETSNGKLNVYAPSSPEYGYHLRALTSIGNVRFGLTGLNYITNEKDRVEAKSITYDSAKKKIAMNLETSNGPISVE